MLTNYQQTKIAAPPNVGEPIGFVRLNDGRILQTLRSGQVRVHDPVAGTTKVVADFQAAGTPAKFRLYSVSEDGLYGPGIDNDFASNKWLYLYYSPLTVYGRQALDRPGRDADDPDRQRPDGAAGVADGAGTRGSATSSSRASSSSRMPRATCRWTSTPSSRSCASAQITPRLVLPRRVATSSSTRDGNLITGVR